MTPALHLHRRLIGDTVFTKAFWKDLGERAVATVAQTAAGVLIGAGTGLIDADWGGVASVAGMAGLLAVLKGIAASWTGNPESASLVADEPGRHAIDR